MRIRNKWAVGLFLLPSVVLCQNFTTPASLVLRNQTAPAVVSAAPSSSTLTVPADTIAAAKLLSGIHSRVSQVDDPVMALLVHPVYVHGQVAIPTGSLLAGRITRLEPARRMRRPAELMVQFDQISLPDGQTKPISAVLERFDLPHPPKLQLDSEGRLKGTRRFGWKGLTGGLVALGGFATWKFLMTGAGAAAYILPASGASVLAFEFLWPRGNEVHLPPQTLLRIRLNYPLTVQVSAG